MIIRCKGCQSTVWLQPDQAAASSCRQCGQSYTFKGADALKTTGRRLSDRARTLAREHQIDLPGAYSMLLGFMTLDEVRAVLPRAHHRPATAKAPVTSGALGEYDPEFAPSVTAGRLTERQAIERGGREAYAGKLVRRHRLPKTLAYAVADNRMSLLQAIRKRGSDQRVPLPVRVGSGSAGRTMRLVVALVVVAGVGAVALRTQAPSIDSTRARTVGSAEVRTDLDGRLLQVFGPDPRTVLKTFCRESTDSPYHAVQLVPHKEEGGRARLGLLRDPRRPDAILAISIREDIDADRWVAGDGIRPLIASPAPEGAAGAVRRRAENNEKPENITKTGSMSRN